MNAINEPPKSGRKCWDYHKLAVRGIICGAVIAVLGFAAGVIGTAVGMMSAFQTLGKDGIGDPASLARAIDTVLYSASGALGVAGLGWIVLVASVILRVRVESSRRIPLRSAKRESQSGPLLPRE